MRRIPKPMTDRARSLRREATPAERAIWQLVSHYRPAFTRQLVIDRYIVDLACRTAKLAVEFDGSQHQDQKDYDSERTATLEALGWRVIRLWNSDVLANPEGAAEHILSETAECLGGTHPVRQQPCPPDRAKSCRTPLPSREGRKREPRYR
jgi:very-short-patch-repair endonuclease